MRAGCTDGAAVKRAVLLLLGTDIVSAEARAAQVARGIAATGRGWTDTGPRPLPAGEAVRLEGANGAAIDVYASAWLNAPGSGTALTRLFGGLDMLVYWGRPSFLLAAGGMKRIRVPLLVLSVLTAALVLSLAGAVASEIIKLVKATGLTAEGAAVRGLIARAGLLEPARWVYHASDILGSVLVTLLGAFVLFRPIRGWTEMVDVARRYLGNSGGSALGLRDAVRRRAGMTVRGLLAPGAAGDGAEYDEVVVVAHSMGSVVAADLFTSQGAPVDPRLRLITVGSPAELFRLREAWVREAVARLPAAASGLKGWTDLHSEQDWFCDAFPGLPAPPSGEAVKVELPGSWWDRFTGRPHVAYFSHPALLLRLA